MKVVWSPLALDKWVNDIFDRADMLGAQPELGREVPELVGTNYREIIFGNYRIIYKIDNGIYISTVRNCRQLLAMNNIEL